MSGVRKQFLYIPRVLLHFLLKMIKALDCPINKHNIALSIKFILDCWESTFFSVDDSITTLDGGYISHRWVIFMPVQYQYVSHKGFITYWIDGIIPRLGIIPVFFQHMVMVSRQKFGWNMPGKVANFLCHRVL